MENKKHTSLKDIEPRLSAISHQTYKMGESACQLLIEQIKRNKTLGEVVVHTQ